MGLQTAACWGRRAKARRAGGRSAHSLARVALVKPFQPPGTHPEPESVLRLELHLQDDRGNVISEEGQGLALVQCDPAVERCAGPTTVGPG